MKRMLALLLCVFAVLCTVQTACAEEYKTCYVKEAGLEIEVPAELIVISRETEAENPCFEQLGTTAEMMFEYYKTYNVYLNIVDIEAAYEIMVVVRDSSIEDFVQLSEEDFQYLCEYVTEQSQQYGMTDYKTEEYVSGPVRYIYSVFSQGEGAAKTYRLQYSTSCNFITFEFLLISYSPDGMDEKAEILKKIVDSVRFVDEQPEEEPEGEAAPMGTEGYQILYLSEPDLEIVLPAEYVAFTRNMSPDDPAFAQMEVTPEYMEQLMENQNLYLDAITPDQTFEFLIMTIEFPYGDLNSYSEAMLQETIQSRKTRVEADGVTWIDAQVYQHHQAKFLVIDYSYFDGVKDTFVREYYTLYANKIINIAVNTFAGEFTVEQKLSLKEIIDSIQFGTESMAEDPSFVSSYTTEFCDEQTGLVLTLPPSWKSANVGKNNTDYSGKISNPLNSDAFVTFSVQDLFGSGKWKTLWPDLSVSSRDEIDHSLLTDEIVAELMGCDASEIAPTRYGGREYFRIRWTTSVKRGGRAEQTKACTLVRCEGGYLYVFQFAGDVDESGFSYFRRIVAKAKYPDPKSSDVSAAPEEDKQQSTLSVTYCDELSGVTFTVPEGWVEEPLENVKLIDAKFVPLDYSGVFVAFTCEDVYGSDEFNEQFPKIRKLFLPRDQVDNSALSPEVVAEMCGCSPKQVSLVNLGGSEYYRAIFEQEKDGYLIPCTTVTCYNNGYLFMYSFYGATDHPAYKDFVKMVQSVKYPVSSASVVKTWVLTVITSLILTITIYSLPIFIYRWCIRRYPVEKKTAKIIVIVYGVVAWILMSVIVFAVNDGGAAGGAVFLWSFINYRVLIGGKDKRRCTAPWQDDPWTREPEFVEPRSTERKAEEPVAAESREDEPDVLTEEENAPSEEETAPPEEIYRYCPQCGFELLPDSRFCSRCGTAIRQK